MQHKGTPVRPLRLRKSLVGALRNQAAKNNLTTSAYVRRILEEHLLAEAKNEGVIHPDFSRFDRAVKRYILAYREGTISVAGNLPGKAHRTALEGLSWKVLEEAIEFWLVRLELHGQAYWRRSSC